MFWRSMGWGRRRKHSWNPNSPHATLSTCTEGIRWTRTGEAMDYVNLGKTGLKVSRICLGCMTYGAPATGKIKPGSHAWALNEEESQPFLRQSLDLGINFFDTANVYSAGASEEVLGRFLRAHTRREAVVIATKVHALMRDE